MTASGARSTVDPDTGGDAIPPLPAALLGVLAVASALAVGDLVAALVSPPSSPFLAVGSQFIRLTPEWLKEFATANFGTNDKLVLLLSMAVVIALVAIGAGLASRRSARPGAVVIVVLGLLGAAAAAGAPTFTPVDLAAPAGALAAGLATVGVVHPALRRWCAARGRPAQETADGDDGSSVPSTSTSARRRLVLAAGGTAALAGVAGVLGRSLAAAGVGEGAGLALPPAAGPAPVPVDADFARLGTPTWLTSAADFYRIDTALQVPQVRTDDWSLRIHGMVDREIVLSYDQLRARRLIQAPITMTCVSNDIGGNLISNAIFTGVPLRDLLAEAGLRPGAELIASTSVDGWTSGTPVDTVVDGRDAMLAIGMNGAALPTEHGFPVRMVVPGLYGFVSGCKWITDMEVTTFDGGFVSYWEQRGWARRAPVKTQSRIDVPRTDAVVPAGHVVVAGIAWAQHTGIDRVEVRADGGAWTTADLAAEVSTDTWRMWRAELELPPGRHELQVRATDRRRYTQTPEFSLTIPDGATGWHTVAVTAT